MTLKEIWKRGGELVTTDEPSPTVTHRPMSVVSPFLTLQYAAMYLRNHGVGIRNTTANPGNDGAGFGNVVASAGNDSMRTSGRRGQCFSRCTGCKR